MWKFLTSLKLTTWIFISLAVGLLLGIYVPDFAMHLMPLRTIFLNGVKCIIAPLIFATIVCGINSSGSVSSLGKTGLRAIIWFEIATTFALAIGLFFVNVFRPGDGLSVGHIVDPLVQQAAGTKMSFDGFVEHLIPTSFAEAIVKGDVLQIVIFSVVFGIAVLLAGEAGKPILRFSESLSKVMFRFTEMVMKLAPLGVGAAMGGAVAEHGLAVMVPMLKMVATLYGALIAFILIVMFPALYYARVKIRPFLKELRPSLVLAFATTSSETAYPGALQSLEKIGVSNRIASFVLPLGYSFNLDGSTLYLAIASIFIAQAAHIDLPISSQLALMLALMLTTKGVAAVPRASLVVLSATLTAFGLPLEGIALILGVDEFMDMARTSTNLFGNCVATTVISRWEGEPLNPDFQRAKA